MSHKEQGEGLASGSQNQRLDLSKNNSSFEPLSGLKLGVISDTHISDKNQHLPRAVLDAFKHVDLIIHAGDIVCLAVIDELKSACPEVMVVAGNMDQEEVKKKYPVKQVLEFAGYRVGLMHGSGPAVNLVSLLKDAFKEDDCDLIIFGHSHKAMNEAVDGVLFFNPGSATDLSAASNSFGLIELRRRLNNVGQESKGPGIEARIIKI